MKFKCKIATSANIPQPSPGPLRACSQCRGGCDSRASGLRKGTEDAHDVACGIFLWASVLASLSIGIGPGRRNASEPGGHEPSQQYRRPSGRRQAAPQPMPVTRRTSTVRLQPTSELHRPPAATATDGSAAALKSKLADAPPARGRDKAEHAAIVAFYEARDYRASGSTAPASRRRRAASSLSSAVPTNGDWMPAIPLHRRPSLAMPPRAAGGCRSRTRPGAAEICPLRTRRSPRAGRADEYLDRKPPVLDARVVIDEIATAGEPAAFCVACTPSIRSSSACGRISGDAAVNDGLRRRAAHRRRAEFEPGARHAQIALVRQRLGLAFTGAPGDETSTTKRSSMPSRTSRRQAA